MRELAQYLQVGVVVSTHGLKGEVKVFPTTDDPQRFKELDAVIADTGRERLTLHAAGARMQKNLVILKFREYDRIEEVEPLRQAKLYVSREDAVPLAEDEFYIADLIGIHVFTDEGEELGILTEVLQTAANDVYVVRAESGREVLIPAIRDCILHTDPAEDRMEVHLLPGLR